MLRVFEPNLGTREAESVWRQVMSGRVGPGERVAEFESLLCAETGAKHAICCNSGTTALMLAIRAFNYTNPKAKGFNVEVLVPSYTFLAAANAARLCRNTVRLMYVRADDYTAIAPRYGIAPELVEIAVFVSHNGRVENWPAFAAACRNSGFIPLHDAAQSLGLFKVSDKDISTLSFSGPKIATIGQGGAIVTNSDAVAATCRQQCDHGGGNWRQTRIHEAVGGNFRMSDLSAALGVVQMQRLPELLGIRRERFGWYREFFPQMPEDGWCALVRSTKAKECIAALAEAGYEAMQPYRPVQESLPFRNNPIDHEAVKAADELLYLPVHYKASRKDINTICLTILKVDPCALGN